MMMIKKIAGAALALLWASCLQGQQLPNNANYARATESLSTIQDHYAVNDGKHLLRETFPFDDSYSATYLADNSNQPKANAYSYLWPFSGSLSAYAALLEAKHNPETKQHIDQAVLPGLENYYDKRSPVGYASYINSAPLSDRFYDDNIWLGIDFADLYLHTKEKAYLRKAQEIWAFVQSGMDDKLGGGIYWCEQKKESKNTCSNAPAVVYLLKLHEATKSKAYLQQAKDLYAWTKKNLQDPADKLYWDNISLAGKVQPAKYPYNTGQMIQAAALLYKLTKDKQYLSDAQESAKAGLGYFFSPKGSSADFPLLKRSDNWFIAIMLRGYIELYGQDKNPEYIKAFQANLDHAWTAMRDNNGLFGKEWSGKDKNSDKKWLLDQFAMAEMYARLAAVK
ncbi:glycoside hydrolase family 76 protein [Sphingobacterium bambusae]|uniref:Glycoside hydrolase family 76 protein n=1 Tax=Sphingobacterium bambusae TaxID=662858 RepID=A0ABW6BEX5_9SPHI|nr:glycoside hydrolase family 76 protein [Sphingobacterium bambusae]WPL46896.1 glycoside hydrolase family 76 protein [Sphingobacterium bambusae]